MATNETQLQVWTKVSVAENYNPFGIYGRIYDLYAEACFHQEDVYKWDKYGLDITRLN